MCSTVESGFFHNKFVCQDHVLSTDFMKPGGIHLISLAVPCVLDLTSYFIPLAFPPSKLPVFSSLSLPSELFPEENRLHVLPPPRTCSKLLLLSTHIETPLPNHIDGPPTSSQIFVQKLKPATANIISMENTYFFLSVDTSDWEYRCLNDQNSSSKPRARHSLLKELNLPTSDLTPRK